MSEYEQAKQHYDECLNRLREISHDFSPEGQQAFLKALNESQRAYTDLFWADRDRVAIEADQLKDGA